MNYLIQFFGSVVSAIGFGLIFSIPKKTLLISGFNAGFGWMIYRLVLNITGGAYIATFLSAFIISLISEVLAKKLRYPASIFIFPGVINLCPGVYIYRTMSYFIANENQVAIASFYQSIAIAGAIAFGVLLASSFSSSLRSYRNRTTKRTKYVRG